MGFSGWDDNDKGHQNIFNPCTARFTFKPQTLIPEALANQRFKKPSPTYCKESYLNCVRSGTVPCVYGGDQAAGSENPNGLEYQGAA